MAELKQNRLLTFSPFKRKVAKSENHKLHEPFCKFLETTLYRAASAPGDAGWPSSTSSTAERFDGSPFPTSDGQTTHRLPRESKEWAKLVLAIHNGKCRLQGEVWHVINQSISSHNTRPT